MPASTHLIFSRRGFRAVVPEEEPQVDSAPAMVLAPLRSLGAVAHHPSSRCLREETARALREAGFQVNVWTVNEAGHMERVIRWGATGIITDFPDRLAGILGAAMRPIPSPILIKS